MIGRSRPRQLFAGIILLVGVFLAWVTSFGGIYAVQEELGLLEDFNLGAARIHVEGDKILLSARFSPKASPKHYGFMPARSDFAPGVYRAFKENDGGVVAYFELDDAQKKKIDLLLSDPGLQLPPGCAERLINGAKRVLLCKSDSANIGYWPEKRVGVSVLPPSEEMLISAFGNIK